MKKVLLTVMLIMMIFSMACAPGPNPNKNMPNNNGEVAGFWMGCWHGFIVPFTFIGTWFSDDVNIYEVHNTGLPYNIGLGMWGFLIYIIGLIRYLSQ